MSSRTSGRPTTGRVAQGPRAVLVAGIAMLACLAVTACDLDAGSDPATGSDPSAGGTAQVTDPGQANGGVGSDVTPPGAAVVVTSVVDDRDAVGSLASNVAHRIDVTFDPADYAEMVQAYASTGTKAWMPATVTIDGTTHEQAGMRLKGNSSLVGLRADGGDTGGAGAATSAALPETLPWLIRLDEYVDGQSHDGLTELVVRSNLTPSALNEAVALELFDQAGLASQDAIAVRFGVNGSDPVYRLVVEHPEQRWMEEELGGSGTLYKAESTGNWRHHGSDPDAYDEVFDLEAGQDDPGLAALIDLLDFVNNSDDDTFARQLPERLDVEAFATYLAMQRVVDNADDIDGPGNNAYLFRDAATGRFTIVNWDLNLAFGVRPAGAPPGGAGAGDPGDDPGDGPSASPPSPPPAPTSDRATAPGPDESVAGTEGGFWRANGLGAGGDNPLVQRVMAEPGLARLVEQQHRDLWTDLVDTGTASRVVQDWQAIITSTGLVRDVAVQADADAIGAVLGLPGTGD